MKRAIACVRHGSAQVDIEVDGHLLAAGAALNQYGLLLASLAACTALTLRDVAAARQWPLQTLDVYLTLEMRAGRMCIERRLFIIGIDAARQAVLLDLAHLTPLTLLLGATMEISTALL